MRILLLLLVFLSPIALSARYHTIIDGGITKFKGQIVEDACMVDLNSGSQIVDMGTISSSSFNKDEHYVKPVPFFINLVNCNEFVASELIISFSGVSDSNFPNYLSVGVGDYMAKGVAIAIFDDGNNLQPMNQKLKPHYFVKNGNITIPFIAKYVPVQNSIVGGKVNAMVNFHIIYQ